MTNYEISLEVVNKLKEELNPLTVSTHKIDLFPEDPERFIDTNPTGAVLVFLGEKRLTEPQNDIYQIEICTLKVHILNINLNIENKLYDLADECRNIIENMSILGTRPYLTTQSEPLYFNNFFWHTELTFIIPLQYIKE